MARKISIQVNTTGNWVRISDFDDQSNHINFETTQGIGELVSYERKTANMDLTLADDEIRFVTKVGQTGFFKHSDIDEVAINGTPSVTADLGEVITAIAAYIFPA